MLKLVLPNGLRFNVMKLLSFIFWRGNFILIPHKIKNLSLLKSFLFRKYDALVKSQKKVPNHYPVHFLFMWIVLRVVIWHLFWEIWKTQTFWKKATFKKCRTEVIWYSGFNCQMYSSPNFYVKILNVRFDSEILEYTTAEVNRSFNPQSLEDC